MIVVYRILQILFMPFYWIFFGIRIIGRKHELPKGPCLICANHISMHDICLLALALRRPICFFAKKEIFTRPRIAKVLRWFGVIPVNRGHVDLASMQEAINVLKNGKTLGIFPQGTRCPDVAPESTEVKSGVGMIAFRAKSSVLPIRIITKDNRIRFFRRITVLVGEPILYEELGFEKGTMREYETATAMIFQRICSLDIPEKGRVK